MFDSAFQPPELQPQPQDAPPEGIAVHVRVRPLNSFERNRGDHECVHCDEASQTVRFVTQPAASRGIGGGVVKALTFDSVVSGSSQVDVFRTVRTQALLQDALQGHAVTVFAYGQTGSGKTYTISGDDSSEPNSEEAPPWSDPGPSGLVPRALGTLFATIAQWTREGRLSSCSVRAPHLSESEALTAPLTVAPPAPTSCLEPSPLGSHRAAGPWPLLPRRCVRRIWSSTTSRSTTCSIQSPQTCSCARTRRRASSSRTCCRWTARAWPMP